MPPELTRLRDPTEGANVRRVLGDRVARMVNVVDVADD